jgi:5-methylcytosine-specific restriction endonuclease McrA
VRDPRPGTDWSVGRTRRRARYAAWMASDDWQERRRRWLTEWTAAHGRSPVCQACGGPWDLEHGHLHHRDYRHLGDERLADLIPLDRDCHDRLHALLDSAARPPRTQRAQASDTIVAHLRRHADRWTDRDR